jgi:hypothetical protein
MPMLSSFTIIYHDLPLTLSSSSNEKHARLIHQWEFQDPIHGGTLVPYGWPYELWGYSLKFRPEQ